jgi:hypothetical protein
MIFILSLSPLLIGRAILGRVRYLVACAVVVLFWLAATPGHSQQQGIGPLLDKNGASIAMTSEVFGVAGSQLPEWARRAAFNADRVNLNGLFGYSLESGKGVQVGWLLAAHWPISTDTWLFIGGGSVGDLDRFEWRDLWTRGRLMIGVSFDLR